MIVAFWGLIFPSVLSTLRTPSRKMTPAFWQPQKRYVIIHHDAGKDIAYNADPTVPQHWIYVTLGHCNFIKHDTLSRTQICQLYPHWLEWNQVKTRKYSYWDIFYSVINRGTRTRTHTGFCHVRHCTILNLMSLIMIMKMIIRLLNIYWDGVMTPYLCR